MLYKSSRKESHSHGSGVDGGDTKTALCTVSRNQKRDPQPNVMPVSVQQHMNFFGCCNINQNHILSVKKSFTPQQELAGGNSGRSNHA